MILRHRTGPAFQAIKDGLAVGLNALTLTDITKNATYGVEIESLVLEINAPASSQKVSQPNGRYR